MLTRLQGAALGKGLDILVSDCSSCLGGPPALGPRLVDMGSRKASLCHMASEPAFRSTTSASASSAGQSLPEP